jgi:hypothetical protein
MRQLKIYIPIALLFAFVLSLYIGPHVIAQTECQLGPVSTISGDPNLQPPPCNCPPAIPFEYDTVNSGVTIAPGESTMVSVKGGCPPYSWADPGNGYSWSSGATTLRTTNILQCAPDTGGGWGPSPIGDYDAVALINVTDSCGSSDSTIIRNSSGIWANQQTDCWYVGPPNDECESIKGNKKYVIQWVNLGVCPGDPYECCWGECCCPSSSCYDTWASLKDNYDCYTFSLRAVNPRTCGCNYKVYGESGQDVVVKMLYNLTWSCP